ncbi:hypothetical protein DEO72_LG6g1576 [Vigna unguiculata]|uniref:Uncharacterized protein n=1 Tax=Vigna unguiculata TaxID=3917 RepID=A0A4D6M9T6_VIGUN|nr:hypothetical protein DEO72_LG6g1576 [Vigna unguiculata]
MIIDIYSTTSVFSRNMNSPDSVSMAITSNLVDPTLMDQYPHDCVHKFLLD